MTGRPARVGSSRTSTEAKNASMSTCRMLGVSLRSRTERQPAEALGKGHPGTAALFLGPAPYGLPGPAAWLGELGAVALDGGSLALDGLGHVDPLIGLQRAGQEHGGHLMGRAGGGEVERECGRGHHGIQKGRTSDAMVAMVEV